MRDHSFSGELLQQLDERFEILGRGAVDALSRGQTDGRPAVDHREVAIRMIICCDSKT